MWVEINGVYYPPKGWNGLTEERHYDLCRMVTEALGTWVTVTNITVPMMVEKCAYCGEPVSLDGDDWFPTRINGDSRYGYEPYHKRHHEEVKRDILDALANQDVFLSEQDWDRPVEDDEVPPPPPFI